MIPLIVIPARFASGRFPGKPLAQLAGKPLIRWTWESAVASGLPVVIATDDESIASAARGFGAEVIMTSDRAKNGTERCAEVLARLPEARLIINWQGDAPLMPAIWPHRLIEAIEELHHFDVATIAIPGNAELGSVHVEIDGQGTAREFARLASGPALLHQGIYAYRPGALASYPGLAIPHGERMHSLEQLRWGAAFPVGVVVEPAPSWPMGEVNYPRDVESVAAVLEGRHATP